MERIAQVYYLILTYKNAGVPFAPHGISGVFRGGLRGLTDTKMNIIKMKLTQIVSRLVISLRSELHVGIRT